MLTTSFPRERDVVKMDVFKISKDEVCLKTSNWKRIMRLKTGNRKNLYLMELEFVVTNLKS
jgi:hypothetical protein